MEFYFAFLRFLVPIIGFNSQRDGILPEYLRHRTKRKDVSIPNGMEFYTLKRRFKSSIKIVVSIPNGMEFYAVAANSTFSISSRFNSQRDGILQSFQAVRNILYGSVSIPNGMEFYSRVEIRKIKRSRFQFPTG